MTQGVIDIPTQTPAGSCSAYGLLNCTKLAEFTPGAELAFLNADSYVCWIVYSVHAYLAAHLRPDDDGDVVAADNEMIRLIAVYKDQLDEEFDEIDDDEVDTGTFESRRSVVRNLTQFLSPTAANTYRRKANDVKKLIATAPKEVKICSHRWWIVYDETQAQIAASVSDSM